MNVKVDEKVDEKVDKKIDEKEKVEEKEKVDEAIKRLLSDSKLGQQKKGELHNVFVYKFQVNNQQKLLAYSYNKNELILMSLGNHENFYRDLKKSL